MPDPTLPVATLDEALPLLRRPFTPEAIKFKVQTVFKDAKGCVIVSYIDARLVIERLNAVVGGRWDARYSPATDTTLWCHLEVFDVMRSDIGKATGIEAEKARVSDSLKRAAVQFGIGVSVYALPQVTVWANRAGDPPRVEQQMRWSKKANKMEPTLVLTADGLKWLREGYASWLETQTNFGAPLDHGDVADAGGMEEEPAEEEFVAEKPAPLDDDEAKTFRSLIEKHYENIRAIDPQAITPGQYNAWLADAGHSHAELDRLAAYMLSRESDLKRSRS